jgi:hypothetical protein
MAASIWKPEKSQHRKYIGMNPLDAASDIATVVMAIVAVGAYGWFQIDILMKRARLEEFLKGEVKGKRHKEDLGQRTVLFLASQLRMTEAEVMQAGFKSKKIKCVPGFDKERHRTDAILFEYDHKGEK